MADPIDWSKFVPDTPPAAPDSAPDWSKFVPEAAPKKPGLLRKAGDLALDVTQGAYGAIGAGASLFGADNPIASLANEIAQGAGQMQSADRQAEKQAQAQRMQEAEKSGSALNELGAAWENFKESPLSFAAQGVGSTIPTGIIATLAGVAGAPALVGTALSGLVGAGIQAGSVKNAIYEDQMQRGQAAGLSPEEAKAKAIEAQSFGGENAGQIALGGALGTLDALGIERMLAGGTSGIKNILGRTAVGTVAEMLPEGAQGGQERLASNLAAQRAGYDANTWQGVVGQGATEALASAGPGAVGGALTPYEAPAAKPALDPNAGPISRAAIQATQQQAIGALPAPGQLSGEAAMQMGNSAPGQDPTGALDLQRRNTELQDARAKQEAERAAVDPTYLDRLNGRQVAPQQITAAPVTDAAPAEQGLPFTQPPYAGPAPTVGEQGSRWADPRIAIAGEPIPDPAAQLEIDRPSTQDQFLAAQRKRAQGELLSQQEAALLNGPDPFEGQTMSLASPVDPAAVAAREEAIQDVAFANGDEPANVRVFSSQDLPDGPSGNQRGAGLTRPAAAVIEGLGRLFGTQYRFYDSPNAATRGDGFVLRGRRPGVAYVRATEGDAAPLVVAGHETYHTFTPAERARFSAAIEPFVDVSDVAQLAFLSDYTGGRYQAKVVQLVQAGVAPTEVIDAVIDQAQQDGTANLTRAALREEFDADIFGNRMKDTGFWEKVFTELKAQDRTLLVKIRDSIKQVVSYLKSQAGKVRGFDTDRYIRDLDAVQRIAARTLLSAANTQQKGERGSRAAEGVVRSANRDRLGPYPTESMATMNQNWHAKKGTQYAIEQAADGFYLTRSGETNEGQRQAERGRAAGAAPDAERRGSVDAAPDVRQRAAGGSEPAARQSRAPLAVESRVRTDADGRVSLTGIHFSRQPRRALSGSYYGTGLKGAEGRRLQGASDRRLLSRVYAYVNEGKGVKPEAGVGSYPHTVKLSNLYDFVVDPLKLIRKHQGDLNAVESAILDEGFDGYYVRDAFGNQGAAVVLGDASIGVEAAPVEAEVMRSPKRTLEKENQVSVTVGGKPGEFGWSPAAKLAAAQQEPAVDPAKLIGKEVPPFVGPTQQRPNLEAIGESVRKVLAAKPARDTIEALTGAKVTGVSQIAGSWEGKPEPSFVLSGEMSFEQANEVSNMLGFFMAQDATVAAQPWFEETEDQIPAILISQNKVMTAEQVKALSDAAREAGLDYSTTVDGRGAKFLHFGDQDGFRALSRQVTDIAKVAGLKEVTPFHVRSNLNDAETYLESGVGRALRGTGDEAGSTGPSDLFRRAVDSILVPYAKAVGAEGYRFSPERYGRRFGLTDGEVEYIRAALRPKSGKALSTVPLVTGAEKLEPPRNNTRTKERGVTKNDLLWALQGRTAQVGFIEPGDYSPEARKIIADAIADEVIYNLGKESGKNAVGWYDAALKKAKETYERVFPELRQDKDREMLFDAILGIASQGNIVHSNAVFAGRMYHLITREGMTMGQATKALSGTFGKQTVSIEKNYVKLEHLLDTNGYDRMREFFNTKATVGELNAILRKDETLFGPNGKPLKIKGAAEQTVSGWMVFGPKIGSFINNLHGDYSTLTADLWFSRTWNRMLGYVFNHKAGKENDQYVELYRAMVEEARTGVGRDLVGTSQAEIDAWAADPESMLTFARETHLKREAEYKTIRDDAVTPLRQAAKNLLENREEAIHTPRTDWERYFQQTAVEQAQKTIRRKTGVNISIADIQAVLWYHEKDLYKSFGVGDSKAEAADYADAAARFVDRFNEGDLFFVEEPKPRYVVGEKGSYLRDEGDVSRSARRNTLGFYSQLSRAVEGAKFQTQPAGQWKMWLAANQGKLGVKADEVQWSGLNEWLDLQGTRKVEKAEVVRYLALGGVQIQEVQKGDMTPARKAAALRELGWSAEDLAPLSDRELEAAPVVAPDDLVDFLERREAYDPDMSMRDMLERADAYGFEAKAQPDTKYSDWRTPGGTNYQEVLLTLPDRDPVASQRTELRQLADRAFGEQRNMTPEEAMRYRELTEQIRVAGASRSKSAKFVSSHWAERNVLAHLRMDDRIDTDGKKVLFVQEIQSDWGQEGRRAGFGSVENWTDNQIRAAVEENDPDADTEGLDRAMLLEMARYADLTLASSVPLAPFVTDTKAWVSLAIKRVVSMAAEQGYDRVALVSGQQAADVFSLSKQVDAIEVHRRPDGFRVRADRDGRMEDVGIFDAKKLPDVVGKELAEKIIAQNEPLKTYQGDDLKVGGEGMRAFYDRLVPQVASDVLKKLGGKLTTVEFIDGFSGRNVISSPIPGDTLWGVYDLERQEWLKSWAAETFTRDPEAAEKMGQAAAKNIAAAISRDSAKRYQQVGFDITPALREKVTGDGLPLFSAARTRFDPEMHRDFIGDVKRVLDLGRRGKDPKQAEMYGRPIQVMRTPPVLRAVYEKEKANSRPFRQSEAMVGTGASIYLKSQNLFPGSNHLRPVEMDAVSRLPYLLADPLAVFQSTDQGDDPRSFKVLGTDSKGFFVAALKPGYLMKGASGKTNFTATIYPTDLSQIQDWLKKGTLRYWDDRLGKGEAQGITGVRTDYLGPLSLSNGPDWLPGGTKSLSEMFSLAKAPVKIITRSELEGTPEVMLSARRGSGGTIDVDGKTRPTSNSNGRPIAQTDDALRSFWRWFGDSKMVDDRGRPLVLYHSSLADLTRFNRAGKFMGHTGTSGISVTDNPAMASRYLERYADYGWVDGEPNRPFSKNIMALYVKAENPLFRDEPFQTNLRLGAPLPKDYVSPVVQMGYDALVRNDAISRTGSVKHGPARNAIRGREIVVFNPEQIKSVTGNTGAFDPTDPDITRSAPRANFGDMTQAQEDALRAVGLLREPKTIRERFAELTDNLAKRLTQGVVDQYAPLKELDFRSYVLARMSKGTDGTFEAMLYYGRPQINGDTVKIDTAPGGLIKVLSTLSGEQDRFLAWVAANRAEQLSAEGREFLFTPAQIQELKGLNQGQMADGRGRQVEYARVLREFNAFQDSVLAIAEARGLIDAQSRQVWQNGFYVPFYRNMEDGTTGPSVKSGLVNQYAFKKLKGSSRQLNEDLLANTLQNMAHLLSAAAKNQAASASLRAAESAGVAHRVPSGTKGAVRFLDAGREQHYLVDDPFIYDAITSLESVKVVGLEKVLSKFKHWLTLGVTINPAFQLRSLMRDAIQSIAITNIDTNPLVNVKQGIASQIAKDQDYINALASGGLIRFNSLLEGNRADHTRKLIKMGVADSTILDTLEKVEMFFTKVLDKWLAVGDISESTNRMALYKQQIAAGVDPLLAAYQARDLMDFSMQGQWRAVRFLTQVVPFLNARLQGLYKLGRDGVVPTGRVLFGGGDATDKQIAKRFGAVTGAVAMASIALMAAYADDEDWKKREDWDRDAYWWFKIGDTAFRIPKPFEVGAIGTIAERTAELFMTDDLSGDRFLQRLGYMMSSTFALNPIPQMVKPLLDVYANEDSFTQRPIETMGMERLQPQDRFTGSTSELAKWLGQLGLPEPGRLMSGQYQALSPVQIDALIRGYFSWLGVSATRVVDMGVRAVADRPARPEMQLRDVFFAGNFLEGLPANSSRYVTALYDQSKAIESAYASYRFALRQGDQVRVAELLAEDGDKIRLNPLVTRAKQTMSKLNENIRAIERNMTMSPVEKRAQIDRIKAMQNQIAMRISAQIQ